MTEQSKGQWIVCLRDILAGEDDYLGPFRSQDAASDVARMLQRNIAARGGEGVYDAIVEFVRPGYEATDMREELLEALDKMGYELVAR